MIKNKSLKRSETPARSLAKAITYRVIIILSIFVIAYFTTGDLSVTLTITGITAVSGTIIYFVHERVWSLIRWGRK